MIDDDLAGDLEPAGEHDVERLVERDLLAALELLDVDLGVHGDAHLAAGGEDVDGAVVVGAEERAVGRRRHRELLDLFAERRDVLAGLAQGRREALVLGDGLGQLALGLEQALLEGADPLRGVLEAAAEDDDLFLEGLDLGLELADLALVLGEAPLVLGRHDRFLLVADVVPDSRATLHRCPVAPDRFGIVSRPHFPRLGLRNHGPRLRLTLASERRRGRHRQSTSERAR